MIGHPFEDGTAVWSEHSMKATASALGRDGAAYVRTIGSVVRNWGYLERAVLGPVTLPRHPFALGRFGLKALRSAEGLSRSAFHEPRARALFAGIAAHGMLPLDRPLTAGFGLALGAMCHLPGWPIPRGGAQKITDALAAYLRSLGGEIVVGTRINNVDELSPAKAVLCDLSPKPLLRIAGHKFPLSYRRQLERYRYGMGVFKVDWALDAPIPWTASQCRRAGTLHLGGSLEEIASSEKKIWHGDVSERPFVLVSQPTVFDPSRAPQGKHVAWGYCHVPSGSTVNVLDRIEQQIERVAPGFREVVLARTFMTPADLELHNENLVGGDIAAGVTDLGQFFTRPTWRNYATPVKGLYICSASPPPGVGVHGMCGFYAAKMALRHM